MDSGQYMSGREEMRMADTLSLLSVIAFVIAGVSLAVAIFLWFFFHISSVIGDLSGRTARKSIEKGKSKKQQTELLMRETEAITDPGAAGLPANEDTTEPLTAGSGTTERPKNAKKNGFVILEEILLIHTDEEIAEI